MEQRGLMDKQRIAAAMRRAAQILVNEFSYDGEDPNGVKTYQDDVNYFNRLAAELVEKCNHPDVGGGNVAYISRAAANAGFPIDKGIFGSRIIVDDEITDSTLHFPQPDGTCLRVNA